MQETGDASLGALREVTKQAVAFGFQAGSAGVMRVTNELIKTTLEDASRLVSANVQTLSTLVASGHDVLMGWERDLRIDSEEGLDRVLIRFLSDTRRNTPLGSNGFTIMFKNNVGVGVGEQGTRLNPVDGYHHYSMFRCAGPANSCVQGTAHEGTFNRTADSVWDTRLPSGEYEDESCQPGAISPKTGQLCNMYAMPGCRHNVAPQTNGAVDSGVCPYLGFEPATNDLTTLLYNTMGTDRPRWTSLFPQGDFLLALACMNLERDGEVFGTLVMFSDVQALSRLVRDIRVGDETTVSRVFLTEGHNWLSGTTGNLTGYLIGTSHGKAEAEAWGFRPDLGADGWNLSPVHGRDADDPLIRWFARHAEQNRSHADFAGEPVLVQIDSELAGGGEPQVQSDSLGGVVNTSYRYVNGYRTDTEKELPPLRGFASDGTSFFVSAAKVPLGVDGLDGFWWLTMMIDRDYVLGAIDRSRADTEESIRVQNAAVTAQVAASAERTAAAIKASNDDVDEERERDSIVLYCVVVGSAAALLAVAVVFVGMIIAPIEQLQHEMNEVAMMRLEEVDEEQEPSKLREVGAMQLSFLQMVKNLREFRSYMPASVLVDDEEEAEEAEEEVRRMTLGGRRDTDCTRTGRSVHRRSTRHSVFHRRATAYTRNSVTSVDPGAKTSLGLSKKRVGFAALNVVDFSRSSKRVGQPGTLLSVYLSAVTAVAQKSRGVVDSFNTDRIYVVYNAVKSCACCAEVCAINSLTMTEQAQAALDRAVSDTVERLVVRAACTVGDTLSGNMGTDTMKKFCCVGDAASFVHVLHRVHDVWDVTNVCSEQLATEAHKVHRRLLLPVEFKGSDRRVYELCGVKEVQEEEWMYQLDGAAADDPYWPFSEAMEMYYRGELASASKELMRIHDSYPAMCGTALKLVQRAAAAAEVSLSFDGDDGASEKHRSEEAASEAPDPALNTPEEGEDTPNHGDGESE
eukprot:TRINITY_DN177_c0_g1_i6.p1 TRINITY_DN177_c0_g1~~TRINITY_DN177_c0_g1_i6.p1  ORF type:complete len:1038 (+),score=298.42 TRINITY_DN177_c0_g1_i6:215-3115(+)